MADEPNKRMDDMLKAYADKRRQDVGVPVKLHPATRQMFQAEVARTYKEAPRASWRSWFQRLLVFWPRVAFAATCIIVTLTLVLVVLPKKQVTQLAQREMSESLARDSRLSDKEKPDSFAFNDAPAPTVSTAPVTPPPASVDRLAKQNEADEVKAKSETLALPERRKDGAGVLLREESFGKEVFRQSYSNTEMGRTRYAQQKKPEVQLGAKLQAGQSILDNFELEQIGNQVRVVDQDGSVYSGNVISKDDMKKRAFAAEKNIPARESPTAVSGAVAPAQAPAPQEQQVYFRAIGTNLSLRQQVAIEANILQLQTNVVSSLAPSADAKQNQRSAGARQLIRGNARIGTNQPVYIEINAVPAEP